MADNLYLAAQLEMKAFPSSPLPRPERIPLHSESLSILFTPYASLSRLLSQFLLLMLEVNAYLGDVTGTCLLSPSAVTIQNVPR